jgi:hypothetical protein
MKSERHILAIASFLLWLVTPGAVATPAPGPDDFGYMSTPIPVDLRDVSTTGTPLSLGDDHVSGAIPIGFSFPFYNNVYDTAFVSSNGFLSFTPTSSGCCSGQPLPQNEGLNNLVAGFWEDLNPPQGGNIRYETLGSSPNREFVVGFYNVFHYYNYSPVNFEMILHENGNIELQYGDAPSDGGTHSVGIENADGTIGLQVAYGDVSFLNQGFLIGLNPSLIKQLVNGPDLPDRLPPYRAPSAITFETLNTNCEYGYTGPNDTFEFFLNGTSLGVVEGDPSDTCSCVPPIQSFLIEDASLIASAWNTEGSNDLRLVKTNNKPDSYLYVAWSRAVLDFGGSDETVCIFDLDGGNCDEVNLCVASSTASAIDVVAPVNYPNDGEIDLVTQIGLLVPTTYEFKVTLRNPDSEWLSVKDTVPAEWNVGLADNDGGRATAVSANKKDNGKSATKIRWEPESSSLISDIVVAAQTRPNPGKGNATYKPTSCGALYLNDGAVAYLPDGSAYLESNPLCLAAVDDVNGDGIIVRDGSGDEDGDGFTDYEEACMLGTNPCVYDAD